MSLTTLLKCYHSIHNPKVLFLDEPTIGLDIISQQKIRNFLKEINKEEKTTIILTSHYMKDIEELCDKLLVISKGSIIYDGSVDSIRNIYSSERNIVFTCRDKISEEEMRRYGKIMEMRDHMAKISVDVKQVASIQRQIISKHEIIDFRVEDMNIENAVMKMFLSDKQ